MNTATKIMCIKGMQNGALYKLSKKVKYGGYEEEYKYTSYVVVSAANAPYSGPETYIFPSDKHGNVLDWGELDGSFKGGLSHRTALANAGFQTVDQPLDLNKYAKACKRAGLKPVNYKSKKAK